MTAFGRRARTLMPRKPSKSLPPRFAIADAVHLIRGDSPGGTLRQARARFIVSVRDTLAYGGASFDPVEHRRLRSAFWAEVSAPNSSESENAPLAADELEAAVRACPPNLPLVLWSGENWSDRLFLWWALDALSRMGLADRPLWLASPLCIPEWDFLESMGCYNPDQMKLMFGHAQGLGPGVVKAAVGAVATLLRGNAQGARRTYDAPAAVAQSEHGLLPVLSEDHWEDAPCLRVRRCGVERAQPQVLAAAVGPLLL